MTLANRITITRFLFIPVFVTLTLYYIESVHAEHANEWLRRAAIIVFVVTALTDAVDGYVARSRGERTRLGTLLDPLADKTLLMTGLILLTGPWSRTFVPHIPLWYAILVISRDSLLIVGWFVIHHTVGHVEVQPRISGKMATVFQMAIILWVLCAGPIKPFFWILAAAALCTLTSAALYILDGVQQLEKAHPGEHPAPR